MPLFPWGVWGHASPEKFKMQKLGKAISSIVGITKYAVDEYFY